MPAPAWAAFWSPDYGRAIVASLLRRGAHGEAAFGEYVIADPRTAEVRTTVELDEPALTPFQWTPDSRHVVAAFRDGIRFFDLTAG